MIPSTLLPDSLRRLRRYQRLGRWHRLGRRMATPRRLSLTLLAGALGILWLSQAFAGILFRQAGDPARIAAWIPLGLLTYGLWHVVKITSRKPVEPFEWTEAEREWLWGGPFTRGQLIAHRLVTIGGAALLKAGCFGLIMMPDLPCWPLGIIGMFLALCFLDGIRLLLEVVAWGVAPTTLRRIRAGVWTLCGGVGVSALTILVTSPEWQSDRQLAFQLGVRFVQSAAQLTETLPGLVLLAPFQLFARIALAPSMNTVVLGQISAGLSLVVFVGASLFRVDHFLSRAQRARERQRFPTLRSAPATRVDADRTPSHAAGRWTSWLGKTRWKRGAWVLVWRQCLGIAHYPGSVAVAMILPGILSMLAVFTDASVPSMFLQMVGALVFYSFLLLPAALRFDFRRDIDRMSVLKSLPLSPLAVTLGQLFTPVLACSLFQCVVLAAGWSLRPYPVSWMVLGISLLVPVNGLIFAIENLIFLLYPYRPNEEGVGVLIRSVLTFTAKGVLFLLALVVTFVWLAVAHWLTDHSAWATSQTRLAVYFSGGMWCLIVATTAGLIAAISRAFAAFDPSQDTPSLA